MRLTRWEGRDEDGPRAVLIRRDHFPTAMQEALRKLARLEDEEERREISPSQPSADSPL